VGPLADSDLVILRLPHVGHEPGAAALRDGRVGRELADADDAQLEAKVLPGAVLEVVLIAAGPLATHLGEPAVLVEEDEDHVPAAGQGDGGPAARQVAGEDPVADVAVEREAPLERAVDRGDLLAADPVELAGRLVSAGAERGRFPAGLDAA